MNEDALRLICKAVVLGENETLVGMQMPESAVEVRDFCKTPQGFAAVAVTALGNAKCYKVDYNEDTRQLQLSGYVKLYDKVFDVAEQASPETFELPELDSVPETSEMEEER